MKFCYYCGVSDEQVKLGWDHLVPRILGGKHTRLNAVPCCRMCNSIKGERTIESMRYRLVLKKIGWPKFSHEHLAWLRRQGFDMSSFDNAKLWFEEHAPAEHHERVIQLNKLKLVAPLRGNDRIWADQPRRDVTNRQIT